MFHPFLPPCMMTSVWLYLACTSSYDDPTSTLLFLVSPQAPMAHSSRLSPPVQQSSGKQVGSIVYDSPLSGWASLTVVGPRFCGHLCAWVVYLSSYLVHICPPMHPLHICCYLLLCHSGLGDLIKLMCVSSSLAKDGIFRYKRDAHREVRRVRLPISVGMLLVSLLF